MTSLNVHDVSGNGIAIGDGGNTSWPPHQCMDNVVTDCVVSHAGQEYTGAVGVNAGFNINLVLSHNTVTDVPYGAISIGAGAARAGYARNNTLSNNRISRFMLKMVDSAGIYVTGRQPGSRMHRNFISEQVRCSRSHLPHGGSSACRLALARLRAVQPQQRAAKQLLIRKLLFLNFIGADRTRATAAAL